LWREEIERLGMSAYDLEESLIAERDQSVAALPYNDHELDEGLSPLREDEDDEEEGAMWPKEGTSAAQQGTSGAPPTAALQSPLAGASLMPSASLGAVVSEFPLCPAASPGIRCHVYLGANDDISPVNSIRAYLAAAIALQERKWGAGSSMIVCRTFQGVGHAECLFHTELREMIVDTVQTQPSDQQLREQAAMHNMQRNPA
jgi:hypothetical protein